MTDAFWSFMRRSNQGFQARHPGQSLIPHHPSKPKEQWTLCDYINEAQILAYEKREDGIPYWRKKFILNPPRGRGIRSNYPYNIIPEHLVDEMRRDYSERQDAIHDADAGGGRARPNFGLKAAPKRKRASAPTGAGSSTNRTKSA